MYAGDIAEQARDDTERTAHDDVRGRDALATVITLDPLRTYLGAPRRATPPSAPQPARPAPSPRPARRLSGLDGLRAVAVLAVVAFHLDYDLLPGGFLGVDVFFVISGFLITRVLVGEIMRTGRLDLPRFYLRRARRLLPTVAVLLGAVGLAAATVWHDQLATLQGGVWSSLFYVTNWWLVADHHSYFVSTGRPSMLQHLWSLAVEEQFYVVWSVVVMAVAGVLVASCRAADPARRLRLLAPVALVLALASTGLMAWYAVAQDLPYGTAGTSRVYYGSDTHSMGLFLGSAAGAWVALRRRGPLARALPTSARVRWSTRVTDLVGLAALGWVVRDFVRVDEFSTSLYRGGLLWFDVLALAVVLCATRPGSLFGRVLDIRPVRWVGLRSYSIYVWHWPVCVVTRPDVDMHGPAWAVNALRLVLILCLSALTYRLVEVPLRTGRWTAWRREQRTRPVIAREIRAGVAVLIAAFGLSLLANPTDPAPPNVPVAAAQRPQPAQRPAAGAAGAQRTAPAAGVATKRPAAHPAAHHAAHRGGRPAVVRPSISAFGDSVLLGAGPSLHAATRHLDLDAVEGRQPHDVLADVQRAARTHTLQPDVLVHTGNNGIISPDQLRDTLRALAGHRVVLVTLRVPTDWQDPDNRTIRSVARSFGNVTILDWHRRSAGHAGWLYSDGLHLKPQGAAAYTGLVLAAFR